MKAVSKYNSFECSPLIASKTAFNIPISPTASTIKISGYSLIDLGVRLIWPQNSHRPNRSLKVQCSHRISHSTHAPSLYWFLKRPNPVEIAENSELIFRCRLRNSLESPLAFSPLLSVSRSPLSSERASVEWREPHAHNGPVRACLRV